MATIVKIAQKNAAKGCVTPMTVLASAATVLSSLKAMIRTSANGTSGKAGFGTAFGGRARNCSGIVVVTVQVVPSLLRST